MGSGVGAGKRPDSLTKADRGSRHSRSAAGVAEARATTFRRPPQPGHRHVLGCHLDHDFEYGALRDHPGPPVGRTRNEGLARLRPPAAPSIAPRPAPARRPSPASARRTGRGPARRRRLVLPPAALREEDAGRLRVFDPERDEVCSHSGLLPLSGREITGTGSGSGSTSSSVASTKAARISASIPR